MKAVTEQLRRAARDLGARPSEASRRATAPSTLTTRRPPALLVSSDSAANEVRTAGSCGYSLRVPCGRWRRWRPARRGILFEPDPPQRPRRRRR